VFLLVPILRLSVAACFLAFSLHVRNDDEDDENDDDDRLVY
jgi:hypothetical protein